jgi:putative hemolysin
MEEIIKTIDIEKSIKEGNNKFLKSLPGFVIKLIAKVICQDELNATIYRSRHLEGVPFINDVLEGWNVPVDIRGEENIPATGRFIFVANHPVGGMDSLALLSMIYRHFPDIISIPNELFSYIPNVRNIMVGINVFGMNTKETIRKLDKLFESDVQTVLFPAGEVARRKKGIISDPDWQKTFITKAIQHKRDIIPVHITGRNSNMFYNVANLRTFLGIKMFVEAILLPREMIRQKNSKITVTIGKVIPYQTFTPEFTHLEWAQKVKSGVYLIPEQK